MSTNYSDKAYEPLRQKVKGLARAAMAHPTRPTPTNGIINWQVKCPYCAVVVEWNSSDGHPPVELLQHDLFTHIAAYHATVTQGVTVVTLPASPEPENES